MEIELRINFISDSKRVFQASSWENVVNES